MTHRGSNDCYNDGCRLDQCRRAHSVWMQQYRARRQANGGKRLLVPTRKVKRQLADLLEVMSLSLSQVAKASGVPVDTLRSIFQQKNVREGTASAINALWEDYFQKDRRRWSVEPLKEAVVRRYGTTASAPDEEVASKLRYRKTLSTDEADDCCLRVGLFPERIWDDWLEAA